MNRSFVIIIPIATFILGLVLGRFYFPANYSPASGEFTEPASGKDAHGQNQPTSAILKVEKEALSKPNGSPSEEENNSETEHPDASIGVTGLASAELEKTVSTKKEPTERKSEVPSQPLLDKIKLLQTSSSGDYEKFHQSLLDHFYEEPVDVEWSENMTDQYHELMSNLGQAQGFAINSFECRSENCIMTVDASDEAAWKHFLTNQLRQDQWWPKVTIRAPSLDGKIIYFLPRETHHSTGLDHIGSMELSLDW